MAKAKQKREYICFIVPADIYLTTFVMVHQTGHTKHKGTMYTLILKLVRFTNYVKNSPVFKPENTF